MSPAGTPSVGDERCERARIGLAHARIGDDHAVEHVGVQAVAVDHLGAERVVREQREPHPAAQRVERGHDVVEQRRVERGEERLDQLGGHERFRLVEHPPVVAVDHHAVAPDPRLRPDPVEDLGRAHRGRGRARCPAVQSVSVSSRSKATA